MPESSSEPPAGSGGDALETWGSIFASTAGKLLKLPTFGTLYEGQNQIQSVATNPSASNTFAAVTNFLSGLTADKVIDGIVASAGVEEALAAPQIFALAALSNAVAGTGAFFVGSLTGNQKLQEPTLQAEQEFNTELDAAGNYFSGLGSYIYNTAIQPLQSAAQQYAYIKSQQAGLQSTIDGAVSNAILTVDPQDDAAAQSAISQTQQAANAALQQVLQTLSAEPSNASQAAVNTDLEQSTLANASPAAADTEKTILAAATDTKQVLSDGSVVSFNSDGSGTLSVAPGSLPDNESSYTVSTDPSGNLVSADTELTNGHSEIITFNSDGSLISVYSGPHGTGQILQGDQENNDGTSDITQFNGNGSYSTVAYSGLGGTGTAGPVTLTVGTGNQQVVVTLGSSSFVFPATRVPYQGSSAYQYGGIALQVQSGQALLVASGLSGLFSDAQLSGPSNQVEFGPGTYPLGSAGSLVLGETGSTSSGVFQALVPIDLSGATAYELPVSGAIYGEPSASAPTEINFGNLHVGQSSTVKVTIGNVASGALEDTLNVGAFTLSPSSGAISLQSGTLTGIAAGSSGTVSLTATALKAILAPLDVAQATLTSHDSVLPDAQLIVPAVIHVDSNVMNYATPSFMVQVGASPSQAVANGGTFDLGTVTQGSFASGLNLYVSNTAPALQSDVVDGSYKASGTGFTVVGLASGSFSGVGGGGQLASLLALSPITTTLGEALETVTIHTTSDDSFSSTALPDQTITVTANVVAATSGSGGSSSNGGTGSTTGSGATGSGGTTGSGTTSGGTSTGTGATSSGTGTTSSGGSTSSGSSSTGTGTTSTGSGTTGGGSTSGTGTTSTGGVTTSGSNVTVTGSGNNVTLAAGGTATTGAGGNTVTLAGAGTVVSNGPDTIRGGPGAGAVQLLGSGATVVGGAGALTVTGGPGSNTIFAGAGGLTYHGGSGSDTVVSGKNPTSITGGSGGGVFFGGGASTISAGAGGALNVEVGSAGDQLYASGPSGVLFGTTGGDILMSSASDSGTSVFFGANGSGKMTFITGSGNDLLALGQGTNTVTLGSGHDVIFANGGATSTTTINAGSGSLDLAFSGATTVLNITAGGARAFGLYAYAPGPDTIHLQGYSSTQAATAIANQKSVAGGTQLSLTDGSVISLVGVSHVTSSLFS